MWQPQHRRRVTRLQRPLTQASVSWRGSLLVMTRPTAGRPEDHLSTKHLTLASPPAQVNAGIAKLTVGRPEDDAAIVPVVSESSAKFVEGLVNDAKEKGATLCQEYKREVRRQSW